MDRVRKDCNIEIKVAPTNKAVQFSSDLAACYMSLCLH